MTALRLILPEDVDALSRWYVDPAAGGEFQWVGFQPHGPRERRERVASGQQITETGGSLAVCLSDDDPTLVGDVEWRQQRTGPAPASWCWEIGILLLPDFRGQGHGSAAQRQLAAYLFEHTTAQRVQAETDVDNVAEQKALERAGFMREGVLRQWQWRGGRWHDFAMYSKLRGEP
jgi:RimJ/RimL family protein N-acetyltransferase